MAPFATGASPQRGVYISVAQAWLLPLDWIIGKIVDIRGPPELGCLGRAGARALCPTHSTTLLSRRGDREHHRAVKQGEPA